MFIHRPFYFLILTRLFIYLFIYLVPLSHGTKSLFVCLFFFASGVAQHNTVANHDQDYELID